MTRALELLAMALCAVFAWLASGAAVEHALARVAGSSAEEVRTVAQVHKETLQAVLIFAGGVLALMLGRLTSLMRGKYNIASPLILPATCAAAALGLALQMGYGDPLHWRLWPGPEFAKGFALAALLGAMVLLLPTDPVGMTKRFHAVLPFLMVAVFVALALFGSGTEMAEDTLINLGGFQPLELVKLAFVLFLGHSLGSRAAKLRYQRDRVFGLEFPKKRLLLPAVAVLALLFVSFVAVKDLGPLMILSLIFLVLFYLATRAGGWVVVAVLVVAGLVWLAVQVPAISGSPKVALRMNMWLHPWTNAQPNGDHTALGRWAIAAGGLTGQGLGWSPGFALPARHTDLVIGGLAEELGALGVIFYILCITAIAGQGLVIAALNRTSERVVTAAGLSVLLVAQWMVIFAGTTTLLPLTGVPAPFLSFGKTSMVVFVLVAAMLARLAENGEARELTNELGELRRGCLLVLIAVLVVMGGGIGVAVVEGVVLADQTSVRGVITHLAPEPGYPKGRVVEKHDPRLEAIARRIPRGPILDREGQLIAGVDADGKRTYPLGDALGTLLGPPEDIVLRPLWMLERQLGTKVRGYGEREDGHALWLAREKEGGERLLFLVPSHEEKPEDRAKAEAMAEGAEVRLLPLPAPDFTPLLPILRAGGSHRDAAIADFSKDVERRTARVTLDARLQKRAAEIVKQHGSRGQVGAASAIVLDANTGEVLARAQWPDFDPGDEKVHAMLRDSDFPEKFPKFTGIYGAWPDKTGLRGIYQGGSAAKLFTSLLAAREGLLGKGQACPGSAGPIFGCLHRDEQGPVFWRPGFVKGIHDHPLDDTHGNIEFLRALAVSCNVWFGQLGLQLGPDAFKKLVKDGVEMGFPGWYDPGKKNSRDLALTAFGQHASMMSVGMAARLVATIAGGGVYRKCPSSMELHATCEEKKIVEDPSVLSPVLAGMEQVMLAGTGRGIAVVLPPGIHVYGKTGTADSIGIKEELPWKVDFGTYGRPHSWFVAVAEPQANGVACQPVAPKRLAFAIVIPRSGLGARFAGPAAMELIKAAHDLGYFGPAQAQVVAAATATSAGAAPVVPGTAAPPQALPAASAATPPNAAGAAQLPQRPAATPAAPQQQPAVSYVPSSPRAASPTAPPVASPLPVASPATRPVSPPAPTPEPTPTPAPQKSER